MVRKCRTAGFRFPVAVLTIAALAALVSRPLCAQAPDLVTSGSREITMKVGNDERTYRLHIPPNLPADERRPLIIAIHGFMSTGKQMEMMTGLTPLSDRKGFVVVYPDGEKRMWRYVDIAGGKQDREFITGIMDALVQAGTVDARRIYLTGLSNGAYMSNSLAIQIGDRIAAIAPLSGTILQVGSRLLKPKRAVPVCYFHGTEDKVVGYDGKDMFSKMEASLGAEELVAWWADRNGCEKEPKIEKLDDKAPNDGTMVERWTYAGAAPVVFYRVVGGGHTWPGMPPVGERILGKSSQDLNASEVIWEFFSRFALKEGERDRRR